MTAKHTPGPWSFDRIRGDGNSWLYWHSDEGGDSGQRVGEFDGQSWKGDDQDEANANLIAAAPELLVELQKVPCPRADFTGDTCEFWATKYAQDRCTRCAAIAKAEGR